MKNHSDLEQFRQVLLPQYTQDADGDTYDVKQKIREDFYEALRDFGLCLEIALGSSSFYEDKSFTEHDIKKYKRDLKFFNDLRRIVRQDAGESIDYSSYAARIKKLIDKHVVGENIREPEGIFIVNELGKKNEPENWTEEKTRNETDLIRTRIKKTIEQELENDPYAKKVFSELLQQAIREAEAMFNHPFKQYVLFKDLENKLDQREVPDIPDPLSQNPHARAYFGIFKLVLGTEAFDAMSSEEVKAYTEHSLKIDEIVDQAVAENSLNTQNIEKQIHKSLLPMLFKMIGMERANQVITQVIQITRVGLSKTFTA